MFAYRSFGIRLRIKQTRFAWHCAGTFHTVIEHSRNENNQQKFIND